ncbi:MAG TPA: DUF3575 domain-containing protein [Parabacteroides sp.]|nr:DUF3575 domain-containing protein [Parabacteroides sp.]
MRKVVYLLVLLAASCVQGYAQSSLENERGATIALKTNALYWPTATPNVGMEVRWASKWTMEAEIGLNPFASKKDDGSFARSTKHFRLHPEIRYWFTESFYKHFIGLHVPFLIYNVSDVRWLGTEDERHQGWGTGAGLSYGYSWVLGKHWNLEASIGVGYLYLNSDVYPCTHCGTKRKTVKKHYVGPTQAALSAVYVF